MPLANGKAPATFGENIMRGRPDDAKSTDRNGGFASSAEVAKLVSAQLHDRSYKTSEPSRGDDCAMTDSVKARLDEACRAADALGKRMDSRADEWSDEARKAAAEARKKGGGSKEGQRDWGKVGSAAPAKSASKNQKDRTLDKHRDWGKVG